MHKIMEEKGLLFGIPTENEKKVDFEIINEINDRITSTQNEIKKAYQKMEKDALVYDQKLSEKIDISRIPRI